MRKVLAGVIGGAVVDERTYEEARKVGYLLAKAGCIVVCGGLGGVMEAAAKGAREAGGDVIGILPGPSVDLANPYVTHPVATNMGHGRNVIIAHTADFLVAIGGEAGTLSEIAFGLKLGKPVFSIGSWRVGNVVEVADCEELMSALRARGVIGGG